MIAIIVRVRTDAAMGAPCFCAKRPRIVVEAWWHWHERHSVYGFPHVRNATTNADTIRQSARKT